MRVAVARDGGAPTESLLALLGTGERGLAESLRPQARRRDFALGRLAAREAVRSVVGASRPRHEPEILRGRSGEPIVHGDDALHGVRVSVTHAKGLAAACAWQGAAFSAGIDIERVRPTGVSDSYAFSRRERELLRRLGDPHVAGLVGWALKEASWKAFTLDPLDGPEAIEIEALDPALGRAAVRAAPRHRPGPAGGLARARVVRVRVADADYVWALAWTGRPAQDGESVTRRTPPQEWC